MRTWLRRWRQVFTGQGPARKRPPLRLTLLALEDRCLLSTGVLQTPLVSGTSPGLHGRVALEQATPSLSDQASVVGNLAKASLQVTSTVPANGDQNPYGVAFVPEGFAGGGPLHPGDILVSNFNDKTPPAGLQGKGTTIVRVTPDGKQSVFFQGKPGLGLTTALGILKNGFVIVGNVPTPDGMNVTPPGSLLILDRFGNVVKTLQDSKLLDGPWDLTVHDEGGHAQVFVSNVLNGTVTRIDLEVPEHGKDIEVERMTQVASGYQFRTDPAALVVGPTGLAFDARKDILYVASTGDNAIFAIHDAGDTGTRQGKGQLIYKDDAHLRGPLGLVLAPNGDLITANGDAVNADPQNKQNSELVEFTPTGKFVAEFSIETSPGGAFGIAVQSSEGKLRFAAVDDITNSVDVWTFHTEDDFAGGGHHDMMGFFAP